MSGPFIRSYFMKDISSNEANFALRAERRRPREEMSKSKTINPAFALRVSRITCIYGSSFHSIHSGYFLKSISNPVPSFFCIAQDHNQTHFQ